MSALTLSENPWTARRQVVTRAWPLIVASASTPLLGLVDTAVLGRLGSSVDLAAVALGSLIFNFVYWSCGFLRMGTTGFVAQASGRGDESEVRASLGRALVVAATMAALLLLLQGVIEQLALSLLSGGPEVERLTADYFRIRIWGAPAVLFNLGLAGVLIGLGETKLLLWTQLFLNGCNILLDLWFAGVLGYGVTGVALGTALSQWAVLLLSSALVFRVLSRRAPAVTQWFDRAQVLAFAPLLETLRANSNILIRTLFLLAGFGWFTEQGARFGETVLAANHVLLQFISLVAFFLDGYAHVVEAFVGQAFGAKDRGLFDRALLRTSELAIATGGTLGATFWLLHSPAIALLTDLQPILRAAAAQAGWAALYMALSPVAFQLDGVFIGTTRSVALRNASVVSFLGFWLVSYPLIHRHQIAGLWAAFVLYIVFRGITLGVALPALRRAVHENDSARRSH